MVSFFSGTLKNFLFWPFSVFCRSIKGKQKFSWTEGFAPIGVCESPRPTSKSTDGVFQVNVAMPKVGRSPLSNRPSPKVDWQIRDEKLQNFCSKRPHLRKPRGQILVWNTVHLGVETPFSDSFRNPQTKWRKRRAWSSQEGEFCQKLPWKAFR